MSAHVWGDYACFTRPEFKSERVSYPLITPSAARGILEAIFWKPEFTWVIKKIEVVHTGEWIQIKRNEITDRQTNTKKIEITEKERVQRNALLLKNVAYNIYGEICVKPDIKDPAKKWQEQFMRRIQKGQCYHRPYLGTRECVAEFREVFSTDTPTLWTKDLGFILHDIDYQQSPPIPLFMSAKIVDGILDIPAFAQNNTLSISQGLVSLGENDA
jgi:CRISPR-associated protein Cas5d